MNWLHRITFAVALGSSLVSAQAETPTLSIGYASAGVTSPIVATCLAGAYIEGDTRGCSGATLAVPASAGSSLFGDGHAIFPGHGIESDGWASAGFGILHAYSKTTVVNADAFYNAQSRAQSQMDDYLLASNAGNAPLTTYSYSITVHGTLTGDGCGGIWPCDSALSSINFSVDQTTFCGSNCGVLVNWAPPVNGPTSTVLTGSFSVNTGQNYLVRFSLDIGSGVNLFAGQSGTATADYANTATLQLLAVTPGANTVGLSGYDYSLAPVPEPASATLTLLGLLTLAAWFRRRSVHIAQR